MIKIFNFIFFILCPFFIFSDISKVKEQAHSVLKEIETSKSDLKEDLLMDLILFEKPKKIVQLGVGDARTLLAITFALKENNFGRIYGYDYWDEKEFSDATDHLIDWSTLDQNSILKLLLEKIKKYKLNDFVFLINESSKESNDLKNIDILHIAGSNPIFDNLNSLKKWMPLVKPAGIIVYDEVIWQNNGKMVTSDVVKYLNKKCILLGYYANESWGIWIKY